MVSRVRRQAATRSFPAATEDLDPPNPLRPNGLWSGRNELNSVAWRVPVNALTDDEAPRL